MTPPPSAPATPAPAAKAPPPPTKAAAKPAEPPAVVLPSPKPATTTAAAPAATLPSPKPAAASAATPPAPKAEPPAPAAKPAAAPLDLGTLEERLKDTKAIGVLTKITLKNQVNDLLSQFRAYYDGKLKTTLAELRRAYDLLVLKVLSLLQDNDPSLANALAASRDAIWGILSDPKKFATI